MSSVKGETSRNGLRGIGYIKNLNTYWQDIMALSGVAVDYGDLDLHIDQQWGAEEPSFPCFDGALCPVSPTSDQIAFFMLDSGYRSKDEDEVIWLAMWNGKGATSLKSPYSKWTGVLVGTRQSVLQELERKRDNLHGYTSIHSYVDLTDILNNMTRRDYSVTEAETLLETAFQQAKYEGTLGVYGQAKRISYFPLNLTTVKQEPIWIKMDENHSTGKKWFGAFLVTETELKDEIYDMSTAPIWHYGHILFKRKNGVDLVAEIAQTAMKERWSFMSSAGDERKSQPYPILVNYIKYTFERLLVEDAEEGTQKIVEFDNKLFFNIGLLDRAFRQLFLVGEKVVWTVEAPALGTLTWLTIQDPKLCSESDHEIAENFAKGQLPPIAQYFSDSRAVVFDAKLEIKLSDQHIFEDGVARNRLPKYTDEYNRATPTERDQLYSRIARDFDSAVDRAVLMAERNYKLAVPQYWLADKEIQFLLPIYLGDAEEAEMPQCALALQKVTSGRIHFYRGTTILDLEMAYNNARLLAKPDVFWLNSITE